MESEKPALLVVSGFGEDGIRGLAEAFDRTGTFSRIEVMQGCPPLHATTHPHERISAIEKKLDEFGRPATLVSHSYGALLSIATASRKQMSGMYGAFINGPLHPDVLVEPPKGKVIFRAFDLQYRMRQEIARECMHALQNTDPAVLKNLLTIVSPNDTIVPPDAQRLPGLIPSIDLPSDIRGHAMSHAKIAAVVKIVMDMLKPASSFSSSSEARAPHHLSSAQNRP